MKTITAILLTAIAAYFLGRYLPWWSIALAAFLVSLIIHQNTLAAFVGGFLGIALLWTGYAAWIDQANHSILSERMANLFPLGGNSILMLLVSGLLGGLVGGLAALSANFLVRRGNKKKFDDQNYYRNKMR